jgi:hypothetical protein
MTAEANWVRLGQLLIRQRVEMDPRYRNRRVFCGERDIEYRLVSDLERGARSNYEAQTVAEAERAYGLPVGTISRALAGGDLLLPAPNGSAPAPEPEPVNPKRAWLHAAIDQLDDIQMGILTPLVDSWINPVPPAAADQRQTA